MAGIHEIKKILDKILSEYDKEFLSLSDEEYENRCKKLINKWQKGKSKIISYSPVEIEIIKEHCLLERCYTREFKK